MTAPTTSEQWPVTAENGSRGSGSLTWKQTTVNGQHVVYGEAGAGPPVLFLHGWGLNRKTYNRALSRLANVGVRVLAPAMPGFGGTAALSARTQASPGTATGRGTSYEPSKSINPCSLWVTPSAVG